MADKENILVVEDSKTQAILLEKTLRLEGYSVFVEENGIKALEVLSDGKFKPEIVLTDLNMPEMDGLHLCRVIKKLYPDIFVIVLSANDDIESLRESFEAGAIDFINKPLNEVELDVRLKNVLRIKSAENDLKMALKKLTDQNKKLDRLAVTDGLTNVYNRKYLHEALEQQVQFAERYRTDLSICMFDLDHFKKVNDIYGHTAGDEALISFAQVLKNHTRKTDIVGRYGGEEFVVIAPNTSILDFYNVVEKLLDETRGLRFKFNEDYQLTFSAGIAKYNNENADHFIRRADDLMYKAKMSGRNRLEID